ncbi:Eco57I restriction-modification methylase domain-containing protein [Brevundimonas sp. P7753]|uniref:Eco57I restriction-modification methylase domain-containing protein n=1 Tax=Brevundimonas sp. P7753 TaxID=2726982 RepID=UPI0015BD971F|nr:Eco57I restriction-modification methylase domain-containing protein [Brevundimonas sp. P7753]NWE51580.1 Eco57I restriction-modification methylase domain-containing protein [Brevundimonas sp. P7753]
MTNPAPFAMLKRNPDVLTCIANLSNDEVFTPPEFADKMLDTLAEGWAAANGGANLWADSTATFLDPCTKSGIFLRQIAKRLIDGLADEIPELQARVDHILTRQLFGIGITRLTGLLARRSLYCSKLANGEHSVAQDFDDADGNVWFQRTEHDWLGDKCHFCGAPRAIFDRAEGFETHAYAFIHTDDPQARLAEIFGDDMQFDVIIGNPPYQLASDGGTRDVPIYQHFVEQARKLQPRFLSMIIPSRWMTSGLGLSEFRNSMLSDTKLSALIDYPIASEVFPGVEIKAGVCYFLRDESSNGPCRVTTIRSEQVFGPTDRNLGEYDVFVRDARAVEIVRRVLAQQEPSVNAILAKDKEFGWTSNFNDFHSDRRVGDVPIYYIRNTKRSSGYIERDKINKSANLVDTWKVLVPKAYGAGEGVPHQILGKPIIAPSPSVCTQSYLFFHLNSNVEAQSLASYYSTRFFRFMVSTRKITQDATHSTYAWVPQQTWDRTWTDAALYEKYGITAAEQAYIESMIRPMEAVD